MKVAGLKDNNSWYMDKIIDSYAHALYPLIEKYLDKKKTVDEDFAIRASKIFDKCFPNARNKIAFSNEIEVFAQEIKNSFEFCSKLRTYLTHLSSSWISVPIDNDTSIKEFKENHCKHVAFLLAPADLPNLLAMGFTTEQIEKLKRARKLQLSLKIGNREIIFCIAEDAAKQQEMFWAVLSKTSWTKPIQ